MSATETRELSGEKAQRIVEAMRVAIGSRGAAGATFDVVAREAGVSRGLLHYYFGTKERLLVEVVRRDCDIRLHLLDEAVGAARDVDDVITALVRSLEDMVEHDPGFVAMLFELFTLARRNPEIAAELRDVIRRTREHVGDLLAAKQREGVLQLNGDPYAIGSVIFALGDGLAMRMLTEPELDWSETVRAGERCAAGAAVSVRCDPPHSAPRRAPRTLHRTETGWLAN